MELVKISYVPKYIIKRMIPKDALKNIDVSGNGNPDGFALKYVNVIAPMEIEENFDVEDLKKQLSAATVKVDEDVMSVEKMAIYALGKKFTMEDIESIGGLSIPVGGHLFIFAPKAGGLTDGMHSLYIKTVYRDQVSETTLERELSGMVDEKDLL